MIEAVMFWNEPNNKSHWDFVELDPEWRIFSDMVMLAAEAVASERPGLMRVRGLGVIPNRAESVGRLIRKLGKLGQLRVCYEAGPTG